MTAHCLFQYDNLGLSNEATEDEKETKDISLWKHSMAYRHKQTLPTVGVVKHQNRTGLRGVMASSNILSDIQNPTRSTSEEHTLADSVFDAEVGQHNLQMSLTFSSPCESVKMLDT